MRKRLLKKEVESIHSRMVSFQKFFESKDIDVADPHIASLLRILLQTMKEIKDASK